MNKDEELHQDIEEIKKSVGRIKRYIFWSFFWNWVKFGVAILVIILGYIYLPQFLEDFRNWLLKLQELLLPK